MNPLTVVQADLYPFTFEKIETQKAQYGNSNWREAPRVHVHVLLRRSLTIERHRESRSRIFVGNYNLADSHNIEYNSIQGFLKFHNTIINIINIYK